MVCPYRVVVGVLTVALAALLSFGWELPWATGEGECEEDAQAAGGDKKTHKTPVAFKDRGAWHRAAYFAVITTLVLFHVELFSGGAICRYLFVKSPDAALAALDAAGMSPTAAAAGVLTAA